jgi:LmbE family N-acetylglucosaminyl deacetylase
MNPYQKFVDTHANLLREAKALPLGGIPASEPPPVPAGAPRVLIFSPHPDDETLVGGLALRLGREAAWNVSNVAVTQGSNKARQLGRWQELSGACGYLGWGLIATAQTGLEGVNVKTRHQNPAVWGPSVERIAAILKEQQPRVICYPHAGDWNSTHIGTHFLVEDALAKLGASLACYTAETEYWAPQADPNLMVESSAQDVADLIAACSFHAEEVRRNPYHLRQPAWMIDNVRRGGELVGGQGGAAPDFAFATLYRLRCWTGGKFEPALAAGKFLGARESVQDLFPN